MLDQNIFCQPVPVRRQELVVVLLPKVDQHGELLLVFCKAARDFLGLIKAVKALVALLQGLNGVFLGGELGKERLKLVLSAMALLIIKGCDNALVHIRLGLKHGYQGIGSTEEAS